MKLASLALAVALAAGCGGGATAGKQSIQARYPAVAVGSEDEEKPATLVLEFTHPVRGVHVSIDGEAVVTNERGKRVVVAGVPAGEVGVMLAADGGIEKAFGVRLVPGQRMVVPIAAPPEAEPKTHPLVQALVTVAVYAAYLGLSSLF